MTSDDWLFTLIALGLVLLLLLVGVLSSRKPKGKEPAKAAPVTFAYDDNLRHCGRCGVLNPRHARFCPRCGLNQPDLSNLYHLTIGHRACSTNLAHLP